MDAKVSRGKYGEDARLDANGNIARYGTNDH
jgi:hypothetical protein